MVTNSLNLSRHVTAQDVRERSYRDTFIIRREEQWHSSSRKDLLRIPHPLQYPVRPQSFMSELKIRSEIFRRFAWWNCITGWMTARALQLREKLGPDRQPFVVGVNICRNERVVHLIQ